jgi:thioredoxin:protein disulfide reductase
MPNVLANVILAVLVWAGSSLWSPGHCREPAARQAPFTLDVTRDEDLSLRLTETRSARRTVAVGSFP